MKSQATWNPAYLQRRGGSDDNQDNIAENEQSDFDREQLAPL